MVACDKPRHLEAERGPGTGDSPFQLNENLCISPADVTGNKSFGKEVRVA